MRFINFRGKIIAAHEVISVEPDWTDSGIRIYFKQGPELWISVEGNIEQTLEDLCECLNFSGE